MKCKAKSSLISQHCNTGAGAHYDPRIPAFHASVFTKERFFKTKQ
jgi:hypothetical protein